MNLGTPIILAVACVLMSACAQQAADAAGQTAVAQSAECATRESGYIAPASTGMAEVKLEGPFLVKSLMVSVDPANPDIGGSILWSKNNMWFKIDQFKGEFFLAEGETLSTEVGKSPWKTIYSGCRIE